MKDESVYFVTHDLEHDLVNELSNELIKDLSVNQEKTYKWKSKQSGYSGAWISGVNMHNLKEWIDYKRHDYDLMIESENMHRRQNVLQEIILDLKQ
jgi:hypothetical protein